MKTDTVEPVLNKATHLQPSAENPILLDARQCRVKDWAWILRRFEDAVTYAGAFVTKDWERITSSLHIEQARIVLTRLARAQAPEGVTP